MSHLALVANWIIDTTQTAFIRGRCILDGIVVLHEVLHEIQNKRVGVFIFKIDFEKAYVRVRWEFLEETMHNKGFDQQWVSWMMQLVRGGQTTINVNGEIGMYFRNARVAARGPAPLLLNVVANALVAMFDKAKAAGHFSRVAASVAPNGLTHLQYVNDTLVFIRNNEEEIINLKFILMCFEAMSGLKINFEKSEAFVTRGDLESQLGHPI